MEKKTLNSCLSRKCLPLIPIAMRKCLLLLPIALWMSVEPAHAQGPEGKSFGFGIILGTPLGVTVKLWTAPDQAFVADFGGSYFGPLRLQADYLWHFDAFHSSIVKMYAGPGLGLAFGNGGDRFFNNDEDHPDAQNELGVGVRVMFGVNIIPRRAPVEIFAEVGPLIAFVPNVGVGVDGGVGIRFYP
jgi:hypothetical protein